MSKITKALKKQAAKAQSVASRTSDASLSGQMTTLARAFELRQTFSKRSAKKKT